MVIQLREMENRDRQKMRRITRFPTSVSDGVTTLGHGIAATYL